MKKIVFSLFPDVIRSDEAITELHNDCNVDKEEISFVYRDDEGEKVSGTGDDVSTSDVAEGAGEGAKIGAVIGAAVGLVATAGLAGPLGPVVAAGPIATALGLTGAIGATATTTVAGAATGGLVGAIVNLGGSHPVARAYEEAVKAGEVLVSVHTDNVDEVVEVLKKYDATEIEVIEESL